MSSIVLELQRKASESKTDLVGLLREALLIARKLKLKEFEKWIYQELNGYDPTDDIPEYRKIWYVNTKMNKFFKVNKLIYSV